jgi:hypothetical protein
MFTWIAKKTNHQVLGGLVVAGLLSGGTAPWWWSPVKAWSATVGRTISCWIAWAWTSNVTLQHPIIWRLLLFLAMPTIAAARRFRELGRPSPPKPVPPVHPYPSGLPIPRPDLDDTELKILELVARHDGTPVPTHDIGTRFSWSNLVTTNRLQRLISKRYLDVTSIGGIAGFYGQESVVLTTQGAELAIQRGWAGSRDA